MTPAQFHRFREKRLKMTRAELAKALDVDPHHVYMLEKGKRGITKILELAVRYLEVKEMNADQSAICSEKTHNPQPPTVETR